MVSLAPYVLGHSVSVLLPTCAATCTWYWQSLQSATAFLYAVSASCHCRGGKGRGGGSCEFHVVYVT